MKYRPYLHFGYYAHRIFPRINGVYLNGSFKIARERKKLIKVAWASIREALVVILSRGIYTADYGIDEAFSEYYK